MQGFHSGTVKQQWAQLLMAKYGAADARNGKGFSKSSAFLIQQPINSTGLYCPLVYLGEGKVVDTKMKAIVKSVGSPVCTSNFYYDCD